MPERSEEPLTESPEDCGRHPDCLFQGGCLCRMLAYQSKPKREVGDAE